MELEKFKDLRDKKHPSEENLDVEITVDDLIDLEEEDEKEAEFTLIQAGLDKFMLEIDAKKNRTLTTKRLTHILYLIIKLVHNHNIDIKELAEKICKKGDPFGMYL